MGGVWDPGDRNGGGVVVGSLQKPGEGLLLQKPVKVHPLPLFLPEEDALLGLPEGLPEHLGGIAPGCQLPELPPALPGEVAAGKGADTDPAIVRKNLLRRRLRRFLPRRAFGFGFGFGLRFDFGFGLDWIWGGLGFRCRFDTSLLCFVKLRGKNFWLLYRNLGRRRGKFLPPGAADLVFAPLGQGAIGFSLHLVGDDEPLLFQLLQTLSHQLLGDPGAGAKQVAADDVWGPVIPPVVVTAQNQPDKQRLLKPVQPRHLAAGQNRIPNYPIGHMVCLLSGAVAGSTQSHQGHVPHPYRSRPHRGQTPTTGSRCRSRGTRTGGPFFFCCWMII